MALERTFSIVKPDGVSRNLIGDVYSRFEKAGLRIVAARMTHLSQREAEAFYGVHRERPFFEDLVRYMTSGPVMLQVLEGENAIAKNREIMGATDPKKAAPGTIRADLAESIERNVVHGSDASDTATERNCVLLQRHGAARARVIARFECLYVGRSSTTERVNLLGLTLPGMEAFVREEFDSKPFRARQLMNWIYKRGEARIGNMTDLAKDFRAQLAGARGNQTAGNRDRTKLDGRYAQMAAARRFVSRPSRWCSSRRPTAARCASPARWAACSTARSARPRSRASTAISRRLKSSARCGCAKQQLGFQAGGDRIITNIVLMGMGEPLANFRNVVPAMRIFMEDLCLDISRRRVTLSTSGLVPQIYKLGRRDQLRAGRVAARAKRRASQRTGADQPQAPDCRAAGSVLALPRRTKRPQRHLRIRDARRRERFSRAGARTRAAAGRPPRQGQPHSVQSVSRHALSSARRRWRSSASATSSCARGLIATIRRTRGDDIDAACGQLVGRVQDRTTVRLGQKLISVAVEP